jgi:hypothetical protein
MYELVGGTLHVDGIVWIAHPASGTSFPPANASSHYSTTERFGRVRMPFLPAPTGGPRCDVWAFGLERVAREI